MPRLILKFDHATKSIDKVFRKQVESQIIPKMNMDDVLVIARIDMEKFDPNNLIFDTRTYQSTNSCSSDKECNEEMLTVHIETLLDSQKFNETILYAEANLGCPGDNTLSSLAKKWIRYISPDYLVFFTMTETLKHTAIDQAKESGLNGHESELTVNVFKHLKQLLTDECFVSNRIKKTSTPFISPLAVTKGTMLRYQLEQAIVRSESTSLQSSFHNLGSPSHSSRTTESAVNRSRNTTEIQHAKRPLFWRFFLCYKRSAKVAVELPVERLPKTRSISMSFFYERTIFNKNSEWSQRSGTIHPFVG